MSKKPPTKAKSNQVAPKATVAAKKTAPLNSKNEPQTKANNASSSTGDKKSVEEKRPPSAPKPPPLTDEEIKRRASATKIQCNWRKYKALQTLKKLKFEKKELDERLHKLEQEAYIQMVKIER